MHPQPLCPAPKLDDGGAACYAARTVVRWALRALARRRDGVEGCHERDLGAGWLT
jgi:hypothetical protein